MMTVSSAMSLLPDIGHNLSTTFESLCWGFTAQAHQLMPEASKVVILQGTGQGGAVGPRRSPTVEAKLEPCRLVSDVEVGILRQRSRETSTAYADFLRPCYPVLG